MVSDLSIYLTIADFLFLQYCPQKKSPRKFGMTHVLFLSDLHLVLQFHYKNTTYKK